MFQLYYQQQSHLVLLSAIRIFIYAFWGGEQPIQQVERARYVKLFIPTAILVLLSVVYGVGSEWIMPFMEDAANVLANPAIYIEAVLKGGN